jgi:hypothetical protein
LRQVAAPACGGIGWIAGQSGVVLAHGLPVAFEVKVDVADQQAAVDLGAGGDGVPALADRLLVVAPVEGRLAAVQDGRRVDEGGGRDRRGAGRGLRGARI